MVRPGMVFVYIMMIKFYIKGWIMEKSISVTEAVRRFSEILNSKKCRGDHYTILRRKNEWLSSVRYWFL